MLYYGNTVGFANKTAQNLLGSGMGSTILKIVFAADQRSPVLGFGSYDRADSFQASDLGVNAQLSAQPVPAGTDFAPLAAGGAYAYGNFITLRRVRVTGFGTQCLPECFVLYVGAHYSDATSGVNNVMSKCVLQSPSENNVHETTSMSSFGSDGVTANARGPTIRHCFLDFNYSTGSSRFVAIASIVPYADPGTGVVDPERFTLTTKTPHHRTTSNNVVINNLYDPAHPLIPHPLNGSFSVVDVPGGSLTQLVFKFPLPPPIPAFDASYAYIGVSFQGPAALVGTGSVTEGNSVYDCPTCFYTDTGTTRNVILRNNYYSNCSVGAYHFFASGVGEVPLRNSILSSTALVRSGTLATFTADAPHRLIVGQVVRVAGARVGGFLSDDYYNGFFAVESISPTDNRVFSYRMKPATPPSADADAPTPQSPITFYALWQTLHFIIENNVFDLFASDSNSAFAPGGVLTNGFAGPPYVFPELVARENLIRHTDSAPSTISFGGFFLDSVGEGLIQENIIDVESQPPIRYQDSKTVRSFNNSTASGTLVRGHSQTAPEDPNERDDELATLIDDAVMLAL